MPAQKASRQAAALNIIRLARTLHTPHRHVFQCSHQFRTQEHDQDNPEPLDEVQWNTSTKRYIVIKDSKFNIDDALLQAMIMLLVVARLQHGWDQKVTCAQLTTWPKTANSGVSCQSKLKNEWEEEIQQLVKDKKMGKKHRDSVNNYNSFVSIYAADGSWPKEARQESQNSKTMLWEESKWAPFYQITEHSVIQWALSQREKERDLSELSQLLLKLLFRRDGVMAWERVAMAKAWYELLFQEGIKDEPDRFCSRVLDAIVQLDLEKKIESFDSDKFVREHLPFSVHGSLHLYRSCDPRDDMTDMVQKPSVKIHRNGKVRVTTNATDRRDGSLVTETFLYPDTAAAEKDGYLVM